MEITDVFKVAFAMFMGARTMGLSLQGVMDMSGSLEATEQIFSIIDRKPEIDGNTTDGLRLNDFKGNMDLDNAAFSYPTRKTTKVLRKLNLAIKEGEKIALVGQSGEFKKLQSGPSDYYCEMLCVQLKGFKQGWSTTKYLREINESDGPPHTFERNL